MSKITVEENETEIVIKIQKETHVALDTNQLIKNIILESMDCDFVFRDKLRG